MQGSARIDELRQKFHENPRRYFAPLANEYRKAGDPEQAIAICRAHLAQQPGHMSGHVVYAQALYDAKRTDEARAVFEKALELDPDNAIVLRRLGDICREKGETAEAKHWYSRALDADPQDREVAAYIAELTEPLTPTPPEEAAPVAAPAAEEVEPVASPAEEEPAVAEPAGEPPAFFEEQAVAPEVQVPLPEPAQEPEVVPAESAPEAAPEAEPQVEAPVIAGEPEPSPEESPWRKTPPHEESPFVTRTMAELYAKQGYRDAALDVYRQLALQHPDDREISDRIEELELTEKAAATSEVAPVSAEPEVAGEAERPAAAAEREPEPEPAPDLAPEPVIDRFPEIVPVITDAPTEAEPEAFATLEDFSGYAPSAEDLNLAEETGETEGQPSVHFTERELPPSGGDAWDTSSWGAGFYGDDDVTLDFEKPDQQSPAPEETPAEAPASGETEGEPAPAAEAEPEPAEEAAPIDLPVIEPLETIPSEERAPEVEEPLAAEEPSFVEESPTAEAPPVAEPPAEEPSPAETAPSAEEAAYLDEPAHAEEAPSPEEPQFVAYSPQLPEEKDLPHFAPKGPTVREFFAAIGAYRPPAREGSSITAHGAVSQMAAENDYPLAADAFANLFAQSEVSEEDSRAAFALSGAITANTPAPAVPEPPPSAPAPAETVASPAQAQESEEDIRKFREWLDGLTES